MPRSLGEAFQNFEIGEIERIIEKELEAGRDPVSLVGECQGEMTKIGEHFEKGDYVLAELILAGQMFGRVIKVLGPKLSNRVIELPETGAKIVLGTAKGDLHDLGKNIFGMMAKASGFQIIDLGVDVPSEKFIESVKRENPAIVGISALITTTIPNIKEIIDLLKKNGLRENVKVILGGAVSGVETKRYTGADAYTHDAIQGIRLCKEFLENSGKGGSKK